MNSGLIESIQDKIIFIGFPRQMFNLERTYDVFEWLLKSADALPDSEKSCSVKGKLTFLSICNKQINKLFQNKTFLQKMMLCFEKWYPAFGNWWSTSQIKTLIGHLDVNYDNAGFSDPRFEKHWCSKRLSIATFKNWLKFYR